MIYKVQIPPKIHDVISSWGLSLAAKSELYRRIDVLRTRPGKLLRHSRAPVRYAVFSFILPGSATDRPARFVAYLDDHTNEEIRVIFEVQLQWLDNGVGAADYQ